MKHIWTVLAQNSSIDQANNNLSIFNCIEEVQVSAELKKQSAEGGVITIPLTFQLISFWTNENPKKDGDLSLKIDFVDPEGKIINTFNNNFPIKKEFARHRNRITVQGLMVTKEGRYMYRVSQKEIGDGFQVVAELPLDVKIGYKVAV